MTISRRSFLIGAAAAGTALQANASLSARPTLRAAPGVARLTPADYGPTPVWRYDDSVPGPVLRVKQGERLSREFINDLPQPSSVHWHGIRIDNAMDGVAGLTQPATPPGGRFVYEFAAPDAGTYWYHPHNRSWEQMARGLSGALIVDEAEPPEVDRDLVLLLDDWRLAPDATIDESFGAMHDWAHDGRIGNWVTVNGDGEFRRPAAMGERLRLRLINAANARIFALELRGMEGWVVALDGMPLAAPSPAGRIYLAPAQRADLIVDVTAEPESEALVVSFERDGGYAAATFDVGDPVRAERLSMPAPLPANPVPGLGSLDGAPRARLRMEGGAMGGMRGAMMGGRMMDPRSLAQEGRLWAFNGMAEMPRSPFVEAALGQTVRIEMINDTAFPHAMHLHGHHFRRIGPDGTAGPLRDTLLVQRGETAEIAFVADNPGDWLLHCHMLEHAASGMMTWIRVG